jgi:hypothetical protein
MQCCLVMTRRERPSFWNLIPSATRADASIARRPYGTLVDAALLLVDNRPYDIFLFGLQVARAS